MARLDHLPLELLSAILIDLPLKSLLAFAATNSRNYIFALACLQTLDVGIHPSRTAAVLSEPQFACLLKHNIQDQPPNRIDVVLPSKKCKTLYTTVYHQNEIASQILRTHGSSLRSLDLSLWDIRLETAQALAKSSHLRHLTLRMDHPHSRAKHMPNVFWYTSPGSIIWNQFYVGPAAYLPISPPASPCSSRYPSPSPEPCQKYPDTIFGRLETLHLERAGITDYQIHKLIQENPNLREIRLKKCYTLTDEFFRDLCKSNLTLTAKTHNKTGLRLLHFEMSDNPRIDNRILQYIGAMVGLKSLSFAGCSNMKNQQVLDLNEAEWNITDLTLPHAEEVSGAWTVEIDPSYMY